jgi:hypothetical protein
MTTISIFKGLFGWMLSYAFLSILLSAIIWLFLELQMEVGV